MTDRMSDEQWASRGVLLIEQMAEELSHLRGWQLKVAKRMGVDKTYISKIVNGGRNIGPGAARGFAARLGIHMGFFTDEKPLHYTAYLKGARTEEAVGDRMSDEQCRRVAEAAQEYVTAHSYVKVAAGKALEQALKPPSGVPSDEEIDGYYRRHHGSQEEAHRGLYLKALTDLRDALFAQSTLVPVLEARIAELEARNG